MQKLFIFISFLFIISCADKPVKYKKLHGNAFGTTYNITYKDGLNRDFTKQVDSLIYLVNKSMSTYMPNSDISKINKGDTTILVDKLFTEVFTKSDKIYQETEGLFDPTIGILVNAWGFGPEKSVEKLDSIKVNELMKYVGFNKVRLKDNKIFKEYQEIYFDFNAIAKGYGIDVIGRFLETKNCKNYLIELGGEIRARGVNSLNSEWRVAIENPNTDGTRSVNKIVKLKNKSLASSGNYRKFKIDENGRKYVHTINAKTGFATESDLLGATVIVSGDCADADGYATSFMAMGYEKSIQFLNKHPELQAYLIYIDENGSTSSFTSENLSLY
ncbi:FAD:protein FMN transferase [Urechidicola croceus]|uniref:FAD:protein FMN transferase n=1 Tax=Urechidicola croceus TaxID=1850246 RepID=A0A1D8P8A5_9FLAO|nr:FAD:protein FMN transferase [Urechidicola croceus]AOW20808.1 thiamine biosynthesis protein ApbE [Urechidicola croceus]